MTRFEGGVLLLLTGIALLRHDLRKRQFSVRSWLLLVGSGCGVVGCLMFAGWLLEGNPPNR